MNAKQRGVRVLMFPWLAHGHVFPFLELAKGLTKKQFHIYFCSTAINLESIKQSLKKEEESSIELVQLHLPSLPDLPPHYHTTKNVPPHLMPTLIKAFQMSSSSFSDILAALKPDLLIYDAMQQRWLHHKASLPFTLLLRAPPHSPSPIIVTITTATPLSHIMQSGLKSMRSGT